MVPPHGSRRPLGLALAVLCALPLAGCDALDFRPSGENFQEVPLPTSGIAVDLAAPGDTLWAWGEVELRYGVALQGKRFAAVEAFWGDRSLGVSTDPRVLRFDSRSLGSGARLLRVVAYAHSGTGSLADRAGAEYVVAEAQRVLVLHNHPPQPVQGLVAEPHEGRLRLRWTPYPNEAFQEYRVYEMEHSQPRLRATIRDRRQASWSDPLYVGGEITYRVAVVAADRSTDAPLTFSTPRPALTAEPLAGGRVGLSWPLSPFYANVTRIVVGMALDPWSGPVAELPGTASSYEDAPEDVFGAERYYSLGFHGASRTTWSTEVRVALDERRPFRDVRYLSASGLLVALDVNQDGPPRPALLRLDPATGAELAWAPLPRGEGLFASASGARLFSRERDRIREWDPHTLTPLREVAVRPLLGATALVGEAWATDEGVVFFSKEDELPGGGVHMGRGVVALDFDRGAVLASLPNAGALVSVSPSGRHLVMSGSRLYAFDGEGLRSLRTLPFRGVFVGEERLAAPTAQGLAVYRFPELTPLHTFSSEGEASVITEDPATGLVSFLGGGIQSVLHVVDVSAGTEVYRVRVAGRYVSYALQGRALWGNGFYRPLDLPR